MRVCVRQSFRVHLNALDDELGLVGRRARHARVHDDLRRHGGDRSARRRKAVGNVEQRLKAQLGGAARASGRGLGGLRE